MSGKDISKNILNTVKSKTGKSVSEKDINKLASTVKPSTMQNEAQLRQLIKQVSGLVNINVPESTVNDIVNAVKNSQLNPNNLEQLMKMISKK
ncbi:stage VI sporulation protein F [Paenibacillus sp. MBLB4367]|uniref:stage VI sporulation protein F n=1 Tax=Paenibacillus sp. MBLB4367 TaxID=3384767 RepID=UPI003907E866